MDEEDDNTNLPVWVSSGAGPDVYSARLCHGRPHERCSSLRGQSLASLIPALFISLFTLMVLIVRPWTIQGQSAGGETRLLMPNDPETDAAGLDA